MSHNTAPNQQLDPLLPALRAYVRLRMGGLRSKESVSDLVQSACRELLKHPSKLREADCDLLRRWLYGTAERKIVDRYRFWDAQKRGVKREIRLSSSSIESPRALSAIYQSLLTPSREAMNREGIERVERAMDALPADYREVILLSRIQRLSRKEIAEKLGRSEASVRSLLTRALVRLSELLGQA